MRRRLLSLALALCMVVSLLPTVLAAPPQAGFVTSGYELTEETFVEELDYTNASRTYTVALSDPERTIQSLTPNLNWEGDEVESIQVAEDKKTAVVTLKENIDFVRIQVGFLCTLDNGKRCDFHATFLNRNQKFGYRGCIGVLTPSEGSNFSDEMSVSLGSTLWAVFVWGNNYSSTAMDVVSVTADDPGVVKVTYLGLSNKGNPAYQIEGVKFGTTALTIETADGSVCKMPVEINVPTAGFSRDTILSEETFIHDQEFTYSKENHVFYYVVSQDIKRVITGVAVKEPHADAVTATVSSDGKLITFDVDPEADVHGERIAAEVTFYNAGNAANLITSTQRISLYNADRWENPYSDVKEGVWYYDAVAYASEKGLMGSTGGGNFDPEANMTRGMLWTILARLDGVDTSGGGTWYEAGRDWAMKTGISDGENAEGNITREQLVTMLWRYAKYKGYDVSAGEDTNILSYKDAFGISDWAFSALQWACGAGLVQGNAGKMDPGGFATRAQVAVILQRFCENI